MNYFHAYFTIAAIPLFRKIQVVLFLLCQSTFVLDLSATSLKQGTAALDSPQAKQLLVVVSDGWDNLRGTLYCFDFKHHKWTFKFRNRVVLGDHGLGIGLGTVPLTVAGAPEKKEGDLKSPAGIFSLAVAFGYADKADAAWIKMPYLRASDTLICVDDPSSSHYNTLVENHPEINDWKSFERMHRKDNLYKWGLFVNHNAPGVQAGHGSCIFIHIWQNEQTGTEGCTAMNENDLVRLLRWLDPRKRPELVQLPKKDYQNLAATFGFPKLL